MIIIGDTLTSVAFFEALWGDHVLIVFKPLIKPFNYIFILLIKPFIYLFILLIKPFNYLFILLIKLFNYLFILLSEDVL